MKKDKVSFGLAGCGDIAEAEYEALRQLEGVELRCVMDTRLEYARQFGEKAGSEYTDSLETLLSCGIDAVIIAAPHHLHRSIAVAAAEAGVHIVMEKPLANSLADGKAIVDFCREKGVLLSVAYVQRYRPLNILLRGLLKDGVIGKPFHLHVTDFFEKPESYWSGGYSGSVITDWRKDKGKSGGGVLLMNGSHTLDYLMDMIDLRVEGVYGFTANRGTPAADVEDDVSAIIRCIGGIVIDYSASTVAAGNPRSEVLIMGTEGSLRLGSEPALFLRRPLPGYEAGKWTGLSVEEQDPWQDGRNEFFRLFVAALRSEGQIPVPVPGEDALPVLSLVESIYRSAETDPGVHTTG